MRFILSLIVTALCVVSISRAQATVESAYDPTACQDGRQESVVCLAQMNSHPRPILDSILRDHYTLSQYSFWQVGPEAVNLYDAPGGSVIGQMGAGFNFVHAINTEVAGWIQRIGGQWISRDDAEYTRASSFTGYLLPDDWRQPFAIILDKTGIYTSLSPGEKGSAESGYVTRRYDVVNIFAEAWDESGNRWYLIGPNQWLRQEFVAKFAPVAKPAEMGERWMAVDLFEQTLIAYEGDRPVFATLVSTGLPKWSTNEGSFPIWARLERDSMSGATGAPDAYALQAVPWTMYFDGGISLHGAYWHDDFGYRRSHGCVNLSVSDAKWLYDWSREIEADDELVNQVYVYSTGEYAGE